MNDTLTIAKARHRRLAKLVKADGSIASYDESRTFDLAEIEINDLHHLGAVLDRLLHRSDCAILRGQPISGPRVDGVRRLLYPDKKTGDQPTLRDVPHRWLAIDMDGLDRPDDIPAGYVGACAEEAIQHLPAAFRDAHCIAQPTGSHGLKPGIRMRLWFWLNRPTMGDELKRWLHDVPVDRSIFGAAQLTYTAAPLFEGVRVDHLPTRLVELAGEECVAVPPPEELAPPPPAEPEPRAPITEASGSRYGRAALERAADRILQAGEGNRHPTIIAEGRGLARLIQAGMLVRSDVVAVITAAARAAGKDDAAEIEACLQWAFDNPSTAVVPEVRHAS